MRRREFIRFFGSTAVAWPLIARAQQPDRMRRIGVLMSIAENDPEAQFRVTALREGFEKLGWTEGRNINVDYRWLGGDAARAKADAAELVSQKPDVIIAASTLLLAAVRNETSTVPIVFVGVGDPIAQGFVSSLAHPGGNITGFTAFEFTTAPSGWSSSRRLLQSFGALHLFSIQPRAPTRRNLSSQLRPWRLRPG